MLLLSVSQNRTTTKNNNTCSLKGNSSHGLHTGGCSPYKKNKSYMSDQYVPAEPKSTGKEGGESGEKYEQQHSSAATHKEQDG